MENNNQCTPAWYWTRGLHDAIIEDVKFTDTPQVIDGRYRSNCLTLYIYAKCAMFDMDVKEIRFYNCGGYEDLLRYKCDWWIYDELSDSNGKYTLAITFGPKRKERKITLRFTDCEVIR